MTLGAFVLAVLYWIGIYLILLGAFLFIIGTACLIIAIVEKMFDLIE